MLQMRQELWAVDLDLYYSDSQALYSLVTFTTGGKLHLDTHSFDIQPPVREEKKTRRRRLNQEDEVGIFSRLFTNRLLINNISENMYSDVYTCIHTCV